jgi:capsular exopolysaccharide synthesis family protein
VSGYEGPGYDGDDESSIDLGAFFDVLWRGKWAIIRLMVVACLLGGVYAFVLATPVYRASAQIILDTRTDRIADMQSVVSGLPGDTSAVNSEVEVLRSRKLLGRVVDALNLTEDPEFNRDLRAPGLKKQMIDRARGMLGIAEEPAPVLSPEAAAARAHDGAVAMLAEAVRVANIPLSFVYQVSVETRSAEKSARIAGTLAELYILGQVEVKFAATEQATQWLSERVSTLKQSLEDSETAVSDFSASINLVSPQALGELERRVKDIRDRIARSELEEAALASRLDRIDAATDPAERARQTGDPTLIRRLPDLDNPARRPRFERDLEGVIFRLRRDHDTLREILPTLRNSREELSAQITRQREDLIRLQQLTREAEAERLLYENFLARLKKTTTQHGNQQADSRILSDAVIPREPHAPKKARILLMSAVFGGVFGAGLVLWRAIRRRVFTSARQLELHSGLAVVGQIPLAPVRRARALPRYLAKRPAAPLNEAMRNLRTSIGLSARTGEETANPAPPAGDLAPSPPTEDPTPATPEEGAPPAAPNGDEAKPAPRDGKVIVLTSSVPGEGKTTNSLALAEVYAGLGRKVLLVDGDLRERSLTKALRPKAKAGLRAALAGEAPLADLLVTPDHMSAAFLPADAGRQSPADLFADGGFAGFLADLRAAYDVVIVDTPPVLAVPDARLVIEAADVALFVVGWNATARAEVDEALRSLSQTRTGEGPPVTGLVLSRIDPKRVRRYGGTQYGYGYT